jgi:uncharacterized membrane protein
MTWLHRYRVRHYLRNSIWVLPVFAMAAAVLFARALHRLDEAMAWESSFQPDNMRAVLGTLAGSMFTFVVFVCSSLLLVVQLASAQLTPRIIGVLFKDTVTKVTLALFVFMFTFAIAALLRIGATVPLLTAEIAVWSTAGCICVFLYLIDHVGKMLRPSGALQSVASKAHQVIESVYPRRLKGSHQSLSDAESVAWPSASTSTVKSSKDGVVLAFDVQGLVVLAVRYDCVIEFVPQVGNLVAPGDALFRIHGGAGLPAKALSHSIALGVERTMEQDPMFAFRVIVDIASKGLSPAINDPTTAVLALDRLHHLLRHVGNRRLDDEKVRDASGRVRLLYHTPDWEDFVRLAVTEIRQFGGSSIQVARRLRAMLDNLIETLPAERAEPLNQELKLLEKSAQRFFQEPEDRALADVGDSQGVGGGRERTSLPAEIGPDREQHRENVPLTP